jgi:hypothetical protein
MSASLVSNCNWRFITGRRSGRAKGLPARTHTWEGRFDQLDAFLALYPVGAEHEGGYIIDRDIRDLVPKSEVDLILALPPDFEAFKVRPGTSNKVYSKTGTVDDSGHTLFTTTPYPTSIEATRTLSARVHASTYLYFCASLPATSRFSTEVTGQNPRKLSDEIVVTGRFADGGETVITYRSYASAPANVQAAIDLDIRDSVEGFDANEIEGTPWFECSDQVVRGYEEA